MKKILLLAALLLCGTLAFAQNKAVPESEKEAPKFEVTQSDAVKKAFDRYVSAAVNEARYVFRIRVYFSSDQDARATSEAIARSLRTAYPDTGIYRTYDSPNFTVKVGDFHNREDANKLCKKLKVKYPSAYIIKEEKKIEE